MRKVISSAFIKILLLSAAIEFIFQFLKCADDYPSLPNIFIELENVPVSEFLFQWFACFVVLSIIFALFAGLKNLPPSGRFDSLNIPEKFPHYVERHSKMSFFDLAAWCSLIVPFVVVVGAIICGLIVANHSHSNLPSPNFDPEASGCEILIFIGLILGLVSIYGIRFHTRKLTLWIALIGILANIGIGYVIFMLLAISGMGRNC